MNLLPMHSKVSLALGIKGVDWCIIVLCWCVTIMAMLLAINLKDV